MKFSKDAMVISTLREMSRSISLATGCVAYKDCSTDLSLLENNITGGVACLRECRSVHLCGCVCVRVCPRGTLIGAISALPHDRCRLFTAETSMPTPAWVVNVRHH